MNEKGHFYLKIVCFHTFLIFKCPFLLPSLPLMYSNDLHSGMQLTMVYSKNTAFSDSIADLDDAIIEHQQPRRQ